MATAPTPGAPNTPAPAFRYAGPKDVGRAESLYRSAAGKPDLDYAAQLLFSALIANPEHEPAFQALLAKLPAYAGAKRRMVARVADVLGGAPADAFMRAFAAYCAAPGADAALAAAAEAQKAGLNPYAATLASAVLRQMEAAETPAKAPLLGRLIDVLEAAGALEDAARAVRAATQLFPADASFREREKNLLARKYLTETDIESAAGFRDTLKERAKQEALHRPADPAGRADELEQRYRQGHRLEDFRELVRALRESSAARREAALPALQDGYDRFGDKEILWFLREVRLERRWAEVRVHRQVLDESPADAGLRAEHEQLRREALREHVDHLYEVVSSLPAGPDRHRRELELAGRLFEAGRYEEAVKQAQAVRRRSENRLDAWVIMAKSFVQLGFTPEATECFQSILAELANSPHGSGERVLEAKYAYAQFLVQEAEKKRDAVLGRQARKLCSDVMIEDIDYRDVRTIAARADAVGAKGD